MHEAISLLEHHRAALNLERRVHQRRLNLARAGTDEARAEEHNLGMLDTKLRSVEQGLGVLKAGGS